MATEKEAPRRMKKNAAGELVPERFFAGWIDEPTHDAIKQIAVQRHSPAVEMQRQAMREFVERNTNGEKAG